MDKIRFTIPALVFALLLGGPANSFGQAVYGSISGTVCRRGENRMGTRRLRGRLR